MTVAGKKNDITTQIMRTINLIRQLNQIIDVKLSASEQIDEYGIEQYKQKRIKLLNELTHLLKDAGITLPMPA
jgi:uncharacterized protein YjiS (DUF1127 family)